MNCKPNPEGLCTTEPVRRWPFRVRGSWPCHTCYRRCFGRCVTLRYWLFRERELRLLHLWGPGGFLGF